VNIKWIGKLEQRGSGMRGCDGRSGSIDELEFVVRGKVGSIA